MLPEQAAGASYGDSMVIGIAGIDHRNGRPWFDLEPTVGGWGAWQGSDGEDGLINNVNGSLKDLPIEVLETKYPMRMTHYGFRADSGGAGRWRGGNGVRTDQIKQAFPGRPRAAMLSTRPPAVTIWPSLSAVPA